MDKKSFSFAASAGGGYWYELPLWSATAASGLLSSGGKNLDFLHAYFILILTANHSRNGFMPCPMACSLKIHYSTPIFPIIPSPSTEASTSQKLFP